MSVLDDAPLANSFVGLANVLFLRHDIPLETATYNAINDRTSSLTERPSLDSPFAFTVPSASESAL
jgi:hypothetical protein